MWIWIERVHQAELTSNTDVKTDRLRSPEYWCLSTTFILGVFKSITILYTATCNDNIALAYIQKNSFSPKKCLGQIIKWYVAYKCHCHMIYSHQMETNIYHVNQKVCISRCRYRETSITLILTTTIAPEHPQRSGTWGSSIPWRVARTSGGRIALFYTVITRVTVSGCCWDTSLRCFLCCYWCGLFHSNQIR